MPPLKDLNSPIVAQFNLASADDAFYSGTAATALTYQLINVEMVCAIVEITDDGFNNAFSGIPQYINTNWQTRHLD